MIFLHRIPSLLIFALVATLVFDPSGASGQTDPIVARGVEYLKGTTRSGGLGEITLSALALIKADVPASDPSLARALAAITKRFSSSDYTPERQGGPEIYEAAVTVMALSSLDPVTYKQQIELAARYIASQQKPNGCWDYQYRQNGDTSISQYAVLGLWEAENAGVSISPSTWDLAAQWFISSQSAAGSWNYHRDDATPETVAMTAAGVGSLLICERQLTPYRVAVKVANPLLIPIELEGQPKKYPPRVPQKTVTQAIQAGIGWLAANFTTSDATVIGHSPFYALYGIERIGALADKATLGQRDWFEEGRRYIASKQGGNGGFTGQYGDGPNTAWAVLFLTKSTAKTLKKIQLRRLGAGTLIGGRGLPKDLSQISVAGGHVIARPMDGAVEGMLAVLEDPRVEDAASALAGLVGRYRTEGPKALRPFQDRFRKLLTDPDQGIRRVAAWSLARTGDLTMALTLIEALKDPDEGVVAEARAGLQLLSRKVDGYGPPPSATPEEKAQAMAKWQSWYEAVRPAPSVAEESSPGSNPKSAPTTRRTP
jgi:HEAT repeats